MAETNGSAGNGSGTAGPEGNGGGKLAAVLAGAKEVKARATGEMAETIKAPEKTDVWKSVLRVKHDETPRSRALGVLSNVFRTCIRPRSIAMPWPTSIPGAWAA